MQSILDIKGIGSQTASKFGKLEIFTIKQLIEHYPKQYEDRRTTVPIKDIILDEKNNIMAKVVDIQVRKTKQIIVTLKVVDQTGGVNITFFNQPYIKNVITLGRTYNFYGKVTTKLDKLEMQSPEFQNEHIPKIVPIYPSTYKLSQKTIRSAIQTALSMIEIDEPIPKEIRERHNFMSKKDAVFSIHFPDTPADFFEARRRLVFEELFILQQKLYALKSDFKGEGIPKPMPSDYNVFLDKLPFKLTDAQNTVLDEIFDDMAQPFAANRLVQGDVGSGKTVVAAAALFVAVKNGYQGAMMAPTEVLAVQHYEFLTSIFDGLNIRVHLVTGSMTKKQRTLLVEQIDEIDIFVGTHALLEDSVPIPNLGIVITDEQHRFGVRQRLKLSQKGQTPDVFVMSATPIPRTLALILYGDMDISVIDVLPSGRIPIKTNSVDTKYYERIYAFMKQHIDSGRQCYIICPMVEENEKLEDLKNVMQYTEELREEHFSNYTLEYLHGKMKPKEKNDIMNRFSQGEINILVSTTVVEVGVNVPNATIMLIENAERFGLSQLHQLRGRVGRGEHESFCILVSDSKNKTTKQRLKIMETSTNGFTIADTDLKLRGAGEFFGTKQHGLPDMKIANLYTDRELLKLAQQEVKTWGDVGVITL
ncbi:MAG: ATP-dependent DNA helicase RecG [Epulopiscium sp. Nele67-Bin004]|nr:MAG: ATP-dependent DNA helicase RecG [Epulopiscium sp. Nele67-Bin004]